MEELSLPVVKSAHGGNCKKVKELRKQAALEVLLVNVVFLSLMEESA
jgi:hypothetical protein